MEIWFLFNVPVGATNVGSIKINNEPDLQTNQFFSRIGTYSSKNYTPLIQIPKGKEMGGFRLGSTIVLVFEAPDSFKFMVKPNEKILVGQAIGN